MRTLISPFRFDGGSTASTTDPGRAIKQKIINCLIISKLERTGLPYYGAGAASLVFDNIDPLVERDFSTDAIQELRRSVSDASILDIRVTAGDSEGEAVLTVYYKTALSTVQTITFTVYEGDFLTEETPL